MPLTIIKKPLKSLEQGWVLVNAKLTTGATGAVTTVSGKGFANGAASGELGGIVRDDTGDYTVTLPGRGGLQAIIPMFPMITDGSASDVRHVLVTAVSTSARTVAFTFLDADTPAATDPANGSVIDFTFLVRDSSVS